MASVIADEYSTGFVTARTPPPLVAVVEDDDPLRKAVGRLLTAAGLQPILFESAEAYLQATPEPACILLDVSLPGISGLDLQERLRASGTAPPIIIMTASHDAATRERAHQNGCAAYFQKPCDGTALISMITSLTNHHDD